ncbi:MAG: hypothetical protein GY870_08095 [archaeon]|nr:hypothetical protein [archaeon]
MPIGILVMRWDKTEGVKIEAKYPDDFEIDNPTLLQIYSQHELSGHTGTLSIKAGDLNISSHYTGQEQDLYIIVVLSQDEDSDFYEKSLANFSKKIVDYVDLGDLNKSIINIFDRLLE